MLMGSLLDPRKQQTDLGRMLDPIADKLLVSAALMMLVGQEGFTLMLCPATLIILREILVSGLREFLASMSERLPATRLAKWKTGFQMSAIILMLASGSSPTTTRIYGVAIHSVGETLLWISAVLTLVTGWNYVVLSLQIAVAAPRQK